MRVFHDISEVRLSEAYSCVAIGNFDGVHLGHQALVLRAIRASREVGYAPFVMTFSPHPAEILRPGTVTRCLTTISEKLLRLERLGLENVLVQRFSFELSQLSASEFFSRYLVGLKARRIHVGNDFRFGHDRQGDTEVLRTLGQKNGVTVEIQSEVTLHGERISSTQIRDHIKQGRIPEANTLLGYPFFVSGLVVKGDQRGRQLGFPTANLAVAEPKLLPPHGVYAGRVHWKGRVLPSVLNIGVRPTFGGSPKPIVEVHLLRFQEELYGESLRLELVKQLRPERKFASKDELVNQIRQDVQIASEMVP
ncbi:MAG: bifunctional riboflavin kinase/FAD synthetase [Deltaproteobacteria bacterium]|nr:bifunctional riboflavin kinase/FAD synthetase [Deltaproteobacteria bacterium]MBI3293470.1 bifunctional riboflavin kinase/FAD synthetase [Deltaproteobacteria bacterium]